MYYGAATFGLELGEDRERVEIHLENLSWWRFFFICFFNLKIQTEGGPTPVLQEMESHAEGPNELWVYKCTGCGAICCSCYGGAPDERCDRCVVENPEDEDVF